MVEVVFAFGRSELVEELTAKTPETIDSSFGGASNQPLELGKHQLDLIQVRTVRRQVDNLRVRCLDGLPHAGYLMGGQIVHDHDVAVQ